MASPGERRYLVGQLQDQRNTFARIWEQDQTLSANDGRYSQVPSLCRRHCRSSGIAEENLDPGLRNGVLRSRYPASRPVVMVESPVVIADNNEVRQRRRTMRRPSNWRSSGESPIGSYYGEPRSAPPFNPPWRSPATVPSRPTLPPPRPSLLHQQPELLLDAAKVQSSTQTPVPKDEASRSTPTPRTQDLYNTFRRLEDQDSQSPFASPTSSSTRPTADIDTDDDRPPAKKQKARRRGPLDAVKRARVAFMRAIGACKDCKTRKVLCIHFDHTRFEQQYQCPVKDAIDWALLIDHAADQKPAMDSDLQGNGSRFLSKSRVARSMAACSIGVSSNSYHVEPRKTRAPDVLNNVEIASITRLEALLAADSAGDTFSVHGPLNQPRSIPHRGSGKRLPANDPDPTNLVFGITGLLPSSLMEDLTIFKLSFQRLDAPSVSVDGRPFLPGLSYLTIFKLSFPQLDVPPVSVDRDKKNGSEPSAKTRTPFGFGSNSNPLSTDPGPAKPSIWSIADIWTFGLRVSRLVFSGPSGAIHPRRKGGLPVMVR